MKRTAAPNGPPNGAEQCLLLVDNDVAGMSLVAEYLERAGYRVYIASNADDARLVLETRRVHLVIIDLRLEDETDDADKSGLTLARNILSGLPKLIYTNFPSFSVVREAFKRNLSTQPLVVDVVDKNDPLDELKGAIREAFLSEVGINWALEIEWKSNDRFSLLALVDPQLDEDVLKYRAGEIEDLLRKLFADEARLRVAHVLWRRPGRLALVALAQSADQLLSQHLVVCGLKKPIQLEQARFWEHAPPVPGVSGIQWLRSVETGHYAANLYSLASADLTTAESFAHLYEVGERKALSDSLTNFYNETLAAWHRRQPLPSDQPLGQLYYARLAEPGLVELAERVDSLLPQLAKLHIHCARADGKLTFDFGTRPLVFRDPLLAWPGLIAAPHPAMVVKSPGHFSGASLLTDGAGRVWVTDFLEAGYAPELWNYLSLEAILRFDWATASEFHWLYDLELALLGPDFARLDTNAVEQPLRKLVRLIQVIRKLAKPLMGDDLPAYELGLLLQALARLASFEPADTVTTPELLSLAHNLIAAALLATRLAVQTQNQNPAGASVAPTAASPIEAAPASDPALARGPAPTGGPAGLHIDKQTHQVTINGRPIPLVRQAYDLLCYLYDHPNECCTREEIVLNVFHQPYTPSEETRLNVAISRMREKIEAEPNAPRHILTVPGAGYRCVPQPT